MTTQSNVVTLNLTKPIAQQVIREIIKDSTRVFFSKHAEKRMKERSISRTQIIRCLEHGQIIEGPSPSASGNWELRMKGFSAGEEVTVAAALDHDVQGNYIIVITCY